MAKTSTIAMSIAYSNSCALSATSTIRRRRRPYSFPALLKASHAEEHGCLCQITFEHNQQRSLLEGIEDALRTRKGNDFVYYARRLAEIVRAHIRCEEEEVFKRADAILSPEEDDRIARELASYDSPHRAERLRELLKRLAILEFKYGNHPALHKGSVACQ
jgi:hemerythrin-like domain-containing protein